MGVLSDPVPDTKPSHPIEPDRLDVSLSSVQRVFAAGSGNSRLGVRVRVGDGSVVRNGDAASS